MVARLVPTSKTLLVASIGGVYRSLHSKELRAGTGLADARIVSSPVERSLGVSGHASVWICSSQTEGIVGHK